MKSPLLLASIARVAMDGDNVAIAVRRLEKSTPISLGDQTMALSHTTMEGHRFAIKAVTVGETLMSWGLPFGLATRSIQPGDYICNDMMLTALKGRHLDFLLPPQSNFADHNAEFRLNEAAFRPADQVPLVQRPLSFSGYKRLGGRGVGTRNFIVIMGTSSHTGPYARTLAERFKGAQHPNVDGVVAVAHTEGGGSGRPNNIDLVLRTLAGFMVHPNVAAVLAVDSGTESVNNQMLRQFMIEQRYPLAHLRHRFLTLAGGAEASLAAGAELVAQWLPEAQACRRSPEPLAGLKIGLQCGGSDAFSGVSGNPLVGWVTKELVRHGGSANLAETPELLGAEPYILDKVRDLATARAFLHRLDRFQQWAGWHGHSAYGNPSGGNLYRGLYNIVVKSIGAARKKDPEVRLDYVIDYSQPMDAPGFYFMDSPGNDLESIAGQVGAGCNVILFTTGNGSITNFPFVPTIKVVTTTGRYQLLQKEMDVNAGRYLDGMPMDDLGREAFEQTVAVASGQRSVGEKAGHSQVQLWREWRQTGPGNLEQLETKPRPNGRPIVSARPSAAADASCYTAFATPRGLASDQIALIVPTSLCSGQIARMIAEKLRPANLPGVTRTVALPHTEGCGVSRGESERLYLRTMAGYLRHPFVRRALLLEHGCEKTHNDEIQRFLAEQGIDSSDFGWASVQLDGGIDAVAAKVERWFEQSLHNVPPLEVRPAGLSALRLGLTADGAVPEHVGKSFAELMGRVVAFGGTVVVPENSSLWQNHFFAERLAGPVSPTLGYSEAFRIAGLHIMETPTDHQAEIITGLGATGVEVILAYVATHTLSAHPMIPVLQIGSLPQREDDIDYFWPQHEQGPDATQLQDLVLGVANRHYQPKLSHRGLTDFQVTRGLVGVSL